MAEYTTQRRYLVNGSSAVRQEEQEKVTEKNRSKKKQRQVLPRAAVDVIPVAYVFLVAVASVCILLCSVVYIHSKTEITRLSKQATSLQTTLETLQDENQSLQNEIATSTSLDTIREKAEELGMVAAGEDQIIYYEQSQTEYVRQKDDIPDE